MSDEIRTYWEERAETNARTGATTTNDVHLRELEVATIIQTLSDLPLPKAPSALDVGCGDGWSTLRVAEAMPAMRLQGLDYAANMIAMAEGRLAEAGADLADRASFAVGDATDLAAACGSQQYDVAMTDRCLINLDSFENQRQAIGQIARHVRSGGYYVAIENFVEGQDALNAARRSMDLKEIPIRWHNLFFREHEFLEAAQEFFDEIDMKDFCSSYYFATRVVYSSMCQMRGEEPDYNHEIHQLAVRLPWMGQFSPIRMAVMRRKAT